jgi:alkylated DNA repair dioxygenase AlkB
MLGGCPLSYPWWRLTIVDQQADLFSVTPAAVDRAFARARRVALDETSWVEHVPGWLAGSDALFAELLAAAGWEQRTRWMYDQRVTEPRLTAEYADLGPFPLLAQVAVALGEHYRTGYERLWLNLYRDHRDSTGWHGDGVGKRSAQSVVPVLSLGATRRFLIKPTVGGRSVGCTVAAGDLLVMGGRAQRDWRHCVPKQATPAGARISVNFAPSPAPAVAAR